MSEEGQEAFIGELIAYNSHWMDKQYDIMDSSFNRDDLSEEQKRDIELRMAHFSKNMKEDLKLRMTDHFGDEFDQLAVLARK